MVAKPSYEECRRKRLEENKKRMEDLNLTQIALALHDSSPKPSPMKSIKPRTPPQKVVPVRRSNRVANKPAPVYKEAPITVRLIRADVTKRYKRRDLSGRVYASDEARAHAIKRAEEIESGLESGYPTMVKPMLQSHVTGGFWLGLNAEFCRKNLPKRDEIITLIDEQGDECSTIYLPRKTGLSGGWKGFSVAHGLVDGDALVFQLIRPTTFMVYIVRVNGFGEGTKLQVLH